MARTLSITDRERSKVVVPWGEFFVVRATRSVLQAVSELQSKVEGLDESQDVVEIVETVIPIIATLVEGEEFKTGLVNAWREDAIDATQITMLANFVVEELAEASEKN